MYWHINCGIKKQGEFQLTPIVVGENNNWIICTIESINKLKNVKTYEKDIIR